MPSANSDTKFSSPMGGGCTLTEIILLRLPAIFRSEVRPGIFWIRCEKKRQIGLLSGWETVFPISASWPNAISRCIHGAVKSMLSLWRRAHGEDGKKYHRNCGGGNIAFGSIFNCRRRHLRHGNWNFSSKNFRISEEALIKRGK